MSDEQVYKLHYSVEAWGQPILVGEYDQVQDGVRLSTDYYGYTDELFLASILQDDAGQRSSILLISEAGPPSRDLLLAVREQIDRALVLQAIPAEPVPSSSTDFAGIPIPGLANLAKKITRSLPDSE